MGKTKANPLAFTIRAIRAVVIACLIWGTPAGLVFAIWALLATNDDTPVDYPHAVVDNQGSVRLGWLTQEEANQRIAAARDEYLNWAWGEARQPLAYSTVALPFIALFTARAGYRRALRQNRRT